MEFVKEIDEMIEKFSRFEEDFCILEFLEELNKIKASVKCQARVN